MPSRTQKTSVSIPVELINKAKARALAGGFRFSFSGYLTKLITEDLRRGAKQTPNEGAQGKPNKTAA